MTFDYDYLVIGCGFAGSVSACGGEYYRPGGDRRKAITRLEVVRIRPLTRLEEKIAPLIDNESRVFSCSGDGNGDGVEFDPPDFTGGGRSSLYYARVMPKKQPLIVGDPFGCEYDDDDIYIKRH